MENIEETNLVKKITIVLDGAHSMGFTYTQDKVAADLNTNMYVVGNIIGSKNYELINIVALNHNITKDNV